MKVVGVIPARYGAQRFPGKPLHPILGKPLLQWVVEGALTSSRLSEVVVATDHEDILKMAQKLGVRAVMTDSHLPSGTDRVYAATRGLNAEVLVNIQGDEPLLKGEIIDQLVQPFEKDKELPMATLARVLKPGDLEAQTTAKIVLNHREEALYFSRFPIPFSREESWKFPAACVKHIGLYAYRDRFLQEFCSQEPVAIEKAEGLEQLRALYLGARIQVVMVDHESWGVDTPEDVAKVEALLQERKN